MSHKPSLPMNMKHGEAFKNVALLNTGAKMNQDDEKKREVISNMLAGWFGKWADAEPTKPTQSSNNGWISVDEKLPTPYTNVLVYMVVPINDIPTSMVGIGYFDGESYWRYADHFGGFPYHVDDCDDWWASDFLEKCIICWQPLPQPPVRGA